VMPRQVSMKGRVADVLNSLSFRWQRAFDWSIRMGAVCLVAKSDPVGGQAVRLSSKEGQLLGSPSKLEIVRSGTVRRKGRTGKVEDHEDVEVLDGASFRCLLDYRLREGGLVVLESEDVSGPFRLERVALRGDTHGGAFECECEAVSLAKLATVPGLT